MATDMLLGTLPRDANGRPIQAASHLVFQDATATPVVSPKTGVTTAQGFTVPANALTFIFKGTTAIRYGDNATLDGSGSGKGYKTASASTEVCYPCAGLAGTLIYVSATAASDIDFAFELLG
jgi:hypothetical protein